MYLFEIVGICTRVKKLFEHPEDPADSPNILVLDKFKEVVIRAYTYLAKGPTHLNIYPDGNGGLRLEWVLEERVNEVRLSLFNRTQQDFIYAIFDGKDEINENVTAENLVAYLNRLLKALDNTNPIVYTN